MAIDHKKLLVKRLPSALTGEDVESFLKHFGAKHVTVLNRNKSQENSALAIFEDEASSKKALQRLHQLEFLGGRLVAKYATPFHEDIANREESRQVLSRRSNILGPKQRNKNVSVEKSRGNKDKQPEEETPDGISPKFGVKYNISPQLHYLYPPPNITILTNVANAMATVPKFYTQVLHLMNKMTLPPPFSGPTPSPPIPGDSINLVDASTDTEDLAEFAMSSEESELESDSEQRDEPLLGPTAIAKSHVKLSNKRKLKQSKLVLASAPKRKRAQIEAAQVFEPSGQVTSKRIEFKLAASITAAVEASHYQSTRTTELQIPPHVTEPVKLGAKAAKEIDIFDSGFGKIEPSSQSSSRELDFVQVGNAMGAGQYPKDTGSTDMHPEALIRSPLESNGDESNSDSSSDDDNDSYISMKELTLNRVSAEDILSMPQFSKYTAGQPSSKLYIKNVHKQTEEKDLQYIFGRFVKDFPLEQRSKFEIKLMKEGRMKGQAFLTFPNVEVASKALEASHGYLLHGKPIVIQFARSGKS